MRSACYSHPLVMLSCKGTRSSGIITNPGADNEGGCKRKQIFACLEAAFSNDMIQLRSLTVSAHAFVLTVVQQGFFSCAKQQVHLEHPAARLVGLQALF